MERIKICGIRRAEDALLACELGAWAIGFIFHAPSPRHVSPSEARAIVEALRSHPRGARVLSVGVFVDRPVDEMQAIVESVGLDVVQLHGNERPEVAEAARVREVWKAFRVGPDFRPSDVEEFPSRVRILLDTYRPGKPGGTGETFDWSVARGIAERRPVILAGGLSPENIRDAIRAVRPFAIDVSSGVESSPGAKDARLLRELFEAVEHGS